MAPEATRTFFVNAAKVAVSGRTKAATGAKAAKELILNGGQSDVRKS
jgi:hypothetical protein